jgi:transposase
MSNQNETSNYKRRQFWQATIKTWQNSGMSVREFCKTKALKESTFYSWRNKLTNTRLKANKQTAKKPPPFVKVTLPGNEHCLLELELSDGSTLRIRSASDNKTLSNILSALQQVGLC